jgi:hypothetical protein
VHVLYLKRIIMTKRRMTIKDKRILVLLKNGGRKGAKKDFYELLRRAVKIKGNN